MTDGDGARTLMLLSLRPGRSCAILAHLFPYICCASWMMRSSSSVHGSLLMEGSSMLKYRVRHCFPVRRVAPSRKFSSLATTVQDLVPCCCWSLDCGSVR